MEIYNREDFFESVSNYFNVEVTAEDNLQSLNIDKEDFISYLYEELNDSIDTNSISSITESKSFYDIYSILFI